VPVVCISITCNSVYHSDSLECLVLEEDSMNSMLHYMDCKLQASQKGQVSDLRSGKLFNK
jgi:hypothetical protein